MESYGLERHFFAPARFAIRLHRASPEVIASGSLSPQADAGLGMTPGPRNCGQSTL